MKYYEVDIHVDVIVDESERQKYINMALKGSLEKEASFSFLSIDSSYAKYHLIHTFTHFSNPLWDSCWEHLIPELPNMWKVSKDGVTMTLVEKDISEIAPDLLAKAFRLLCNKYSALFEHWDDVCHDFQRQPDSTIQSNAMLMLSEASNTDSHIMWTDSIGNTIPFTKTNVD